MSTFIDNGETWRRQQNFPQTSVFDSFFNIFCVLFPTQKSSAFVGQSGLMNFTLSARGDGCNVKEKRATLQLDDKKVFSAVVEISNNEFILKKVK